MSQGKTVVPSEDVAHWMVSHRELMEIYAEILVAPCLFEMKHDGSAYCLSCQVSSAT